ncbi:MAG TPA: antibiotic biosynthesis monooxygenase [Ktedonobacteraceae bacterium]|nr:antibiotic biosynthesis monooxygenase [Ktedonobacteraceae bacterium]
MELLVATLAHTTRGLNDEALTRVRLVVDTVKNAPGMINARLYAGRGGDACYLMLTSWEDEEFWQKAQERHNPGELLLNSSSELLTTAPEQWQMHYLWGYSRPSAQPTIAAMHLATVRPDQAERVQRAWIESLQRQAMQPTLAFAFLTRGKNVDSVTHPGNGMTSGQESTPGSTFLNLLSWPGETQQKEFYSDQNYKAFRGFLNQVSMERILTLEPQT